MNNPAGIICLWEWLTASEMRTTTHRSDYKWRLAESYLIDDNGYQLNGDGDRHPYFKWLLKDYGKDEDPDPIPGHVATIWTTYGCRLLGFNPPEEADWISIDLQDKLKEINNWYSFIESGHQLYCGTIREAEKHLEWKE